MQIPQTVLNQEGDVALTMINRKIIQITSLASPQGQVWGIQVSE